MMLFSALALLASAQAAEEPTFQYINCVKSEVSRLKNSPHSHEAISDMAVANCESLVAGAAQASVDGTPPELLAAYGEAGITPKVYFERQKEIARAAAKGMALGILADEAKDPSI